MNLMLSDDDLARLLGETAESFPIPDEGPSFVLDELAVSTARPDRTRMLRWTAVAAALVVGVLVVKSFGSTTVSTKQVPAALPSAAAGSTGGTSGTTGTSPLSRSKVVGSLAPAAGAPAVPGTTTFSSDSGAPPFGPVPAPVSAPQTPGFADSAKIVKTGSIALIVNQGKVSAVIGRVQTLAQAAGGYVSGSKSQEFGDDPTSTVSLRVPVDRFEGVVQAVRDQVNNGAGKVDSSSSSGQDVTAQYADVNAQIQSLTAARDRFLTILSRANTIGETLSVQQRVDSVQLQIDQLKGRMRVLKDQTSMATLSVTVSEKPKAVKAAHVTSGLSKSWDNAKHGFASGVESLISRSGKGLLALILAAVGLVVLRLGWRLARRRLV
ncbi:MAG: hypothetical protein JWL79_41 [Frankiales bacterium]|nr:hypothetical protein [Frankiales bacterium]